MKHSLFLKIDDYKIINHTCNHSMGKWLFLQDYRLRWENRAGARPGARVPGLEMPWNPGTNLALGPNDSNLF